MASMILVCVVVGFIAGGGAGIVTLVVSSGSLMATLIVFFSVWVFGGIVAWILFSSDSLSHSEIMRKEMLGELDSRPW